MRTDWSGQQWYMGAPRPSGSSMLTLLTMTEEEMKAAEKRPRRPVGFAPPEESKRDATTKRKRKRKART